MCLAIVCIGQNQISIGCDRCYCCISICAWWLFLWFQVKITSVVNYAWEQRYYYGNLVAVHRDGDYVAFALKGKSLV